MQRRLDYVEKPECTAMNALLEINLIASSLKAQHSTARRIKTGLLSLALVATPTVHAGELGRLFFTPQQRAQLEQGQQLHADKPVIESVTVSGIVQKHGGERTVWINGVPQISGTSDERAPESAPVTLPGKAQPVRIKVGEKVLLSPPTPEQ